MKAITAHLLKQLYRRRLYDRWAYRPAYPVIRADDLYPMVALNLERPVLDRESCYLDHLGCFHSMGIVANP